MTRTSSFLLTAPLSLALALLLTACGSGAGGDERSAPDANAGGEAAHANEGQITLSPEQIAAADIRLGRPTLGGGGTLELPAIIEGDPQSMQVVSAAIGGRVVALTRNLGESVRQGETLAIIESREAAQIQGEIEAARARLSLANSNLSREERLFAQRVTPEQDLIAARTAATEARIALRQAQQQLSAAGGGGGALNRVSLRAPLGGQVISRTAVLGQTVSPDAELFRIANLSTISVSLNLQPGDASRVRPGATVRVIAAGRRATARISFVSPALDAETRLVPALATLDNRAGQWRVGEPVTVSVDLAGEGTTETVAISVPASALQTVEGRSVVFVRTATGFRVVPVIPGDPSGQQVVIRSGLTGRESIVIFNSFILKAELGKGEAGHED
jgi:cobalt-zinc-cadmium efflux system membrane fusion protein